MSHQVYVSFGLCRSVQDFLEKREADFAPQGLIMEQRADVCEAEADASRDCLAGVCKGAAALRVLT